MIRFRKYSLALAESFDAWRVIPRAILVAYSSLVLNLYLWFKSIPTFIQERCDAAVLKMFIDGGVPFEQAKEMACSIVDVVGGPTAAQSTFVTTIIGLSTGIFGLYTATGRRWDGGLPIDVYHAPTIPPNDNRRPRRDDSWRHVRDYESAKPIPPISENEEEPAEDDSDTGPKA